MDQAVEEFKKAIVEPFEIENPNTKFNIMDGITYDNINDLQFNNLCFLESLRIEPPVPFSSYC